MTASVANRSPDSAVMVEAGTKGRALMGGTTAMRAAGKTYLPQFGKESDQAYQARLKGSWLFNGYRKTVRDMTGRVFAKPIELADGASAELIGWCENVDMEGRDLSTFAREVFEDGLSGTGISYIMVDAPQREGTVTQAQAQAQNLRPFMVHIRAEDLLGWRQETISNETRLVQIRIMECVVEPDPKDEFADKKVDQVRVLDLIEGRVQVRLFRKADGTKGWVQSQAYMTDATEITVVPFYANRTGFFTGEALLDDLADNNIAHWQSQSDQRNILHFARVPILFGAGIGAKEPITIGANTAVTAEDAGATLEWVEHSGQAISAGRQDLKDLEFQMEAFGLQLLAARPGAQSATGEALDAAKETSILAMTADALQDALERALGWMATYGGQTGDPTVTVNKDFGVSPMGAQEMLALLQMVNTGNLSRETFISELVRRGMVRSDITPDEEYQRIEDEDFAGAETEMGVMPGSSGKLNDGSDPRNNGRPA